MRKSRKLLRNQAKSINEVLVRDMFLSVLDSISITLDEGMPSTIGHDHDDRYYTKAESNLYFYNKTYIDTYFSPVGHSHVAANIADFSEAVDDRISSLVQNGTGLTWSYNDGLNMFTPTVSLSPFNTDQLAEGSTHLYVSPTEKSNYNTAYGWGNHASAGYLTSFTETDPTVGSHIKAITTTNISNWNTAFSWGNHASAGYLTSFSETDTLQSVTSRGSTTTNNLTLSTSGAFLSTTYGGVTTTKIFTDTGGGVISVDGAWGISLRQGGVSGTNLLTFHGGTGVATFGASVNAGYGSAGGFYNSIYVSGFNNIWAFANATTYGIGYKQGSAGWWGGDTIRFDVSGALSGIGSPADFEIGDSIAWVNGGMIWHQNNDGHTSGLDADLLDGNHASAFALVSHNHDDMYYTELESDARFLIGTTSPSTPSNFNFSIGWNGTYSYVQSHSSQPLELNPLGNVVRIAGNTVWHAGNDGHTSGLDADLLDGQQGSYYYAASNPAGYITSSSLTAVTWYDGWVTYPGYDANTIGGNKNGFTYSTNAPHTGHLVHFGASGYGLQLNSQYNGSGANLSYRSRNGDAATWNTWYRIWSDADFTSSNIWAWNQAYSWGNHALAGYLTSFSETDTLASVTGRGATTVSQVSFTKVDDHAISVGTIRGRAVGSQTGEFIHLYERVHIGGPTGWGAYGTTDTPSYGLSVYGGARIGYGSGGGLAVTGVATFSSSVSGSLFTANNRTTLTNGAIYDNASSGNDIGIGFGAGTIMSTNGSGTLAIKDLGTIANPWGTFYGDINSRGLLIGGVYSNSPFTSSSWIKAPAGTGVFFVDSTVAYYFGLKSDNTVATNVAFIGTSATFSSSVTATSLYSTGASNFATSGGNVGINTTSPLNKLTVSSTTSFNNENTYSIAAAANDVAYKLILGYDTTLEAGVIASVRASVGWKDTWINPNGGALRVGGPAIFSDSVIVSGLLTLNLANSGINSYHSLNRNTLTTENMFRWTTGGTPKWYLGQRSKNSEDGFSFYSTAISDDILYFNPAGNAYFYGNIIWNNGFGSLAYEPGKAVVAASSGIALHLRSGSIDGISIAQSTGILSLYHSSATSTPDDFLVRVGYEIKNVPVANMLSAIGAYAASNPAGYITSASLTDTLNTVAVRGNVTEQELKARRFFANHYFGTVSANLGYPSNSIISVGARFILEATIGYHSAIGNGINNSMWFQVGGSTTGGYQWYHGATGIAELSTAGGLILANTLYIGVIPTVSSTDNLLVQHGNYVKQITTNDLKEILNPASSIAYGETYTTGGGSIEIMTDTVIAAGTDGYCQNFTTDGYGLVAKAAGKIYQVVATISIEAGTTGKAKFFFMINGTTPLNWSEQTVDISAAEGNVVTITALTPLDFNDVITIVATASSAITVTLTQVNMNIHELGEYIVPL